MDFPQLRERYLRTLLDDVLPFWVRHALDANGGINTCIADDGRVLSRDRWNWSQWRAVWVFSKLYNSVERRPEWLEIARRIHAFVTAHGPLPNGHWPLLLDGDGKLLRGFDSIYVDGFAIYGLAELYRATQDAPVHAQAMQTFQAVETAFQADGVLPAWPYPIGLRNMAHGVSMIFSLAYHELAEVTGEASVREAAEHHHRLVMDQFLRKDRGLVLERLLVEGSEFGPPNGTVVVPGHAIESMWFQMHLARARKDSTTLDRACQAIRRHLEFGWDWEEEYGGGLLLAVDADARTEVGWGFPDSKLWWPHTEALYATLLAYEHCREDWCLEWHEGVRAYSYAHYPVKEHGEWRQKLDRHGRPFTEVVALPVKDPFHLPRALIYCTEVLGRLIK